MKQLTYHHIRMKSKGGKATVENGALLSAENHQWFHQQSKADQERMNNAFQEYKREVDHGTYTEAKIEFVDDIDLDFSVKAFDFTIPDTEKIKKEEYNRAKVKQKTKQLIKDYEEER